MVRALSGQLSLGGLLSQLKRLAEATPWWWQRRQAASPHPGSGLIQWPLCPTRPGAFVRYTRRAGPTLFLNSPRRAPSLSRRKHPGSYIPLLCPTRPPEASFFWVERALGAGVCAGS
jgi:hypothetical protein